MKRQINEKVIKNVVHSVMENYINEASEEQIDKFEKLSYINDAAYDIAEILYNFCNQIAQVSRYKECTDDDIEAVIAKSRENLDKMLQF